MPSRSTIGERYEAALAYAQQFFMGSADVQRAATRLTARLRELGIPYAICGGLAVAAHGHVRVTQDVDILLTPDGLRRFKEACLGRGWLERFEGSRGLRDTEENVTIDVLLSGDYPGDGKPKPVAFPDPEEAATDASGVLALRDLILLKLASGMAAPHRLQDLADVIQLIRANALPRDFEAELHPYVRAKYQELWGYAQIEDPQ
ncbi:MAG: hypothetical protein ACE5F1_07780 [Planctomycetota bacterium]